jgi:cyclohexyl-isocyanide hydratase
MKVKIAFVVFQDMTALDFVGIYDPLTRLKTMKFLPDLSWDVCAFTAQVADNTGLAFVPDKVARPLAGYDMVVVPGGFGTRKLIHDAAFVAWLQTAADCPLKVSVCTGSLLLGAAGFLRGRRATTHPGAYADLQGFCQQVVAERVVDEGDVVTARGVTSAIDIGLYLCGRLAGPEVRDKIRCQMDYQCQEVML